MESLPAVILIVDDDPSIRDLFEMLLGDEGYGVLTAADGIQALDVARQEHPDVILVDDTMPRLDGPGFCRAYRDAGGLAPLVLVSASHQDTVAATALACGAAAYIAKPFDVNAAVETVARCITS
jgi:CheY-like chemotaxis protein